MPDLHSMPGWTAHWTYAIPIRSHNAIDALLYCFLEEAVVAYLQA